MKVTIENMAKRKQKYADQLFKLTKAEIKKNNTLSAREAIINVLNKTKNINLRINIVIIELYFKKFMYDYTISGISSYIELKDTINNVLCIRDTNFKLNNIYQFDKIDKKIYENILKEIRKDIKITHDIQWGRVYSNIMIGLPYYGNSNENKDYSITYVAIFSRNPDHLNINSGTLKIILFAFSPESLLEMNISSNVIANINKEKLKATS